MFRLKSLFIERAWHKKTANETDRQPKNENESRQCEMHDCKNDQSTQSLRSFAVKPEILMEKRLDGVRVLLVDDNPDVLDILELTFDECGAEVITATSVKNALAALEVYRPHVLVSDITMPEQDGYELVRQLRRREPGRCGKIPAIALTAHTSAENRAHALESGFQLCLAKPFDPVVLITSVAHLLGTQRSDRCA